MPFNLRQNVTDWDKRFFPAVSPAKFSCPIPLHEINFCRKSVKDPGPILPPKQAKIIHFCNFFGSKMACYPLCNWLFCYKMRQTGTKNPRYFWVWKSRANGLFTRFFRCLQQSI